jgi:DNA-directed RNA polymerase subunit RPC12/RpoP
LFPEVAASWDMERNDGLTPHDVTKSSNKEVWWKCGKCGAGWKATVDRRTLRKHGCPNCSPKRVTSSNNLAVKRPDIAEKWDFSMNGDLTPYDIAMTARESFWWKCGECGESWQAPPERLCRGHGCPYCSGNRVGKINNFAHLHPALEASWATELNAGVKPSDIVAGTLKKYWWKCGVCGEVWDASPASRIGGTNCPYCTGRKVGNFNNLAYKKPDIAKSWACDLNGNLTPALVTLGSHKRVWWRCLDCSREWMATVKDRAGKGSGCPFCAKEMKKKRGKGSYF